MNGEPLNTENAKDALKEKYRRSTVVKRAKKIVNKRKPKDEEDYNVPVPIF